MSRSDFTNEMTHKTLSRYKVFSMLNTWSNRGQEGLPDLFWVCYSYQEMENPQIVNAYFIRALDFRSGSRPVCCSSVVFVEVEGSPVGRIMEQNAKEHAKGNLGTEL